MAAWLRTASTTPGSTSRTRADGPLHEQHHPRHDAAQGALGAPRKPKPVLFAGPGRTVAIPYTFSEKAHAVVYLGRRQIILGRKTQPQDKVKWAGTVGGKALPAGTYVLSVGAQDIAGNETPAAQRKNVTVDRPLRPAHPGQSRRSAAAGGSRCTSRRPRGATRGASAAGTAPARASPCGCARRPRPGTYRLVVAEDGHTTTAVVRVRAK